MMKRCAVLVGFQDRRAPERTRLAAPVIEGFGAFLFIATESLLQSWDGEIRLFPGVPADFTGEFRNLLAQGGKRVSAKMVKGKVVWKEIKCAKDGQ